MPVNIIWEDGDAIVSILCDGCDREYEIISKDTDGLEMCPFCGHYLEVESETGETNDTEEDSWD